MNELSRKDEIYHALRRDSTTLWNNPEQKENQGAVMDAQMLIGFARCVEVLDPLRDENTLEVIDWIRTMTMRGELGDLISRTT